MTDQKFLAINTLSDGRVFYLNGRGNWSFKREKAWRFANALAAYRRAQSVWRGPDAVVSTIPA